MANELEINKKQANQWRRNFIMWAVAFDNAWFSIKEPEAKGSDAEQLQCMQNATDAINAAESYVRAKAALDRIEECMFNQLEELGKLGCDSGKNIELHKRLPRGWLTIAMQSNMTALKAALKQAKDSLQSSINLFQEHSNALDVIRDFLMAVKNPAKGQSLSEEWNTTHKNTFQSLRQLEEERHAAKATLSDLVLTKWNEQIDMLEEEGKEVKGAIIPSLYFNDSERLEPVDTTGVDIGKVYKGRVVSIVDFGAFVELLPGTGIEGLLHISEIAIKQPQHVGDVLEIGQEIEVKCLEVNNGHCRVSRRVLL